MAKKLLLDGRDVSSSEDVVKKIQPCKLPLMCNVDLDSIAASEQPAGVAYMAKYQKFIGELLYRQVCLEKRCQVDLVCRQSQALLRSGNIGA